MLTLKQSFSDVLVMLCLCSMASGGSAKVEETKKLVSEQQLKIQELSRYDVNSDIVQQEKLVEKQLFRRQVLHPLLS